MYKKHAIKWKICDDFDRILTYFVQYVQETCLEFVLIYFYLIKSKSDK